MSGLLSGLANLGLGKLVGAKIYEEPEKPKAAQQMPKAVEKPQISESELIYDRSFDCPVCASKITSKVMKTGRARLEGMDEDLRPRYEGIDSVKYDVITCPICGFSALSRYFKPLIPSQVKWIQENISQIVQLHPGTGETYSYEEAMERFKLALACAIVKKAKNSERAYICLKSGWLLRGWQESLDESDPDYQTKKSAMKEEEEEYLRTALDGFETARSTESPPICGMDETTLDYLMAVLAVRFEKYEMAAKLVSNVLVSHSANSRIKDKARELKAAINAALKKDG